MNVQNNRTVSPGPYGSYDLGRLSVLVAEDSQAARELITTTLKDIGVGTVRKVANGLQAIEYLRGIRGGSNPPVDILITDLEMEPVDGVTLTQWVRRHADSPDPFMRIMIISGSLNVGRIHMGRNAGVHDFIAKPFTLNAMRDRLHSVIHHFRPFILTKHYFGPDRRRHVTHKNVEDKRTQPDPVRDPAGTDGASDGIRIFDIPNYLEAVVTGTGESNLNYAKLEAAQAQRAAWQQDYADWVLPNILIMKRGLALAKESSDSDRVRSLDVVRRHAIDIDGVASYLDYPLMGQVARSLIGVLEGAIVNWDGSVSSLERHVEALLQIVRGHMAGDGGPEAGALLATLSRT